MGDGYLESTLHDPKELLKSKMGKQESTYIEGTLHSTPDLLQSTMAKKSKVPEEECFPRLSQDDSCAVNGDKDQKATEIRRLKTMRVLARWVREFQSLAKKGEERIKILENRVAKQREVRVSVCLYTCVCLCLCVFVCMCHFT